MLRSQMMMMLSFGSTNSKPIATRCFTTFSLGAAIRSGRVGKAEALTLL